MSTPSMPLNPRLEGSKKGSSSHSDEREHSTSKSGAGRGKREDDGIADTDPLMDTPDLEDSSGGKVSVKEIWGRTFLFAVVGFLLTELPTWFMMLVTWWAALPMGLVLPVGMAYFLRWAFARDACYARKYKRLDYADSLNKALIIGCVAGAVLALSAGYFFRQLLFIKLGQKIEGVDSGVLNTKFGEGTFNNGAKPWLKLGYTHQSWLGATCVAPILTTEAPSPNQNAPYWAVGFGSCCRNPSAPCDEWTAFHRASVLKYTEFTPGASDAVQMAADNFKLNVKGGFVLVKWGDDTQSILTRNIAIAGSVIIAVSIALMIWKSCSKGTDSIVDD